MRRREFMGAAAGTFLIGSAVHGQPRERTYRIVVAHPSEVLANLSETSTNPNYRAAFQELRHLGYVEGKNLIVERRSGDGRTDRYPELAYEIVRLDPDLIFAVSRRLLQFLARETSTIPIVGTTDDPVLAGLAAS
jgi:putative tryptophan/tyrosine transport system substrate-binding protein